MECDADKVGSWLDVGIFETGFFGDITLSLRLCGPAPCRRFRTILFLIAYIILIQKILARALRRSALRYGGSTSSSTAGVPACQWNNAPEKNYCVVENVSGSRAIARLFLLRTSSATRNGFWLRKRGNGGAERLPPQAPPCTTFPSYFNV